MTGQIADVVTTHAVLKSGAGAEGNPLVRPVLDRFGMAGLWALKLGYTRWALRRVFALESDYDIERQLVGIALFGWLPAINNAVIGIDHWRG